MSVKSARRVKKAIESVAGFFTGRFMGSAPLGPDVSILPTGLRSLDKALDTGGLPRGHIIELVGPAEVGVSHVAAYIAAKVQRKQHFITIIDMSRSFHPRQAERCGLLAPHLLLTRPATVFDALTSLENLARREGLALVMMGQVTNLFTQADPDRLKTLLGRLRRIIRQSNGVFLFVTTAPKNDPYNPRNYPPGFPLAALAAVRLWIQAESWSGHQDSPTAYKASIAVIKNRLAPAGKGTDIRIKLS